MHLNVFCILDHVSASCLVLSVFPASLDGLGGMVDLVFRLIEELKIYFYNLMYKLIVAFGVQSAITCAPRIHRTETRCCKITEYINRHAYTHTRACAHTRA
jgi:hypothetical protein